MKIDKRKYDYKSGNMLIRPTDEENIWECDWDIFLITDEMTRIGKLSFAGKKERGTIPISIELIPLYRGRGNGSNALKMAREWAFIHRDIYEVEAFVDRDNEACISALIKANFIYRSNPSIEKGDLERYSVVKPKSTWLGLYIIIGVVAGVILGLVIDIPWAGMAGGLGAAIALGSFMDSKEKKHRLEVTGGLTKKQ